LARPDASIGVGRSIVGTVVSFSDRFVTLEVTPDSCLALETVSPMTFYH